MDRLEDADPRVQAPFSKDDARLVQVAVRTVQRMGQGKRAGRVIEEALRSPHGVMVPMLDEKGNATAPIITKDWYIPTARQGQFRTLVEYIRFGGDAMVSPEILISHAETWKLRQQMSGMQR